jgi:hypothetical protein
MNSDDKSRSTDDNDRKAALSRRLEGIGWGVLLIIVGTIWLLPSKHVPPGSWLMAGGLIILGFSAIRYFNALRVSGFSLAVGILALLAGVGEYFALDLPLFALALIGLGAWLLFARLRERDLISGAGRSWPCCWPETRDNNQDTARGQEGGH